MFSDCLGYRENPDPRDPSACCNLACQYCGEVSQNQSTDQASRTNPPISSHNPSNGDIVYYLSTQNSQINSIYNSELKPGAEGGMRVVNVSRLEDN